MGTLAHFDLSTYGCEAYVETGTGHGGTLSKALSYGTFKDVYSVDLDIQRIIEAKSKFPTAKLSVGLSTQILQSWLLGDLKKYESILFFLDAHFPNADYNGGRYDVKAPHAIPLEEELKLIKKFRKDKKDVIICDDARIYEHREWEGGHYPFELPTGGFSWLYKIYPENKVEISLKEHGYIIIDCRNSD